MLTTSLGCYSQLAKYVKTMLPITPRYVPKRYKAYVKHCGDETLAKQGIEYGKGPSLVPCDVKASIGKEANAYFWATQSDSTIYIEQKNAKKYDKNPDKYHVAIQYLLLHELIHWARHHAGLDAEIDGKEAGDSFEVEAYGVDVSYLWDR
jgi:hypothetical protein